MLMAARLKGSVDEAEAGNQSLLLYMYVVAIMCTLQMDISTTSHD
jgi:hypothetical protein